MRLKQLLTETINDLLDKVSKKHEISTDAIIDLCVDISKKYWKWVLLQISKGNFNISVDLDSDGRVIKYVYTYTEWAHQRLSSRDISIILRKFEKLVGSNNMPVEDRDIAKYPDLSAIKDVIDKHSQNDIKSTGTFGDLIYSDETYKIIKISDPRKLELAGQYTGWCTRADAPECRSKHYIEDYGYIYIVFKNGRPYIQFTPDLKEVQDTQRLSAIQELINIFKNLKIDKFIKSTDPDIYSEFVHDLVYPNSGEVYSGIMQNVIRRGLRRDDDLSPSTTQLFLKLIYDEFLDLEKDFYNYPDADNFYKIKSFTKFYDLENRDPKIKASIDKISSHRRRS